MSVTTPVLTQAIVDRVLNSPQGRQAAVELAREHLQHRRDLAHRRESVQTAEARQAHTAAERRARATERVNKAEAALIRERAAAARLEAELNAEHFQLNSERRRLEVELTETASPEIDAMIRELEDTCESDRMRDWARPAIERDAWTGGLFATERYVTSPADRLMAIRGAIQSLRDLKFQAVDDDEQLRNLLTQVRANIPEVAIGPIER